MPWESLQDELRAITTMSRALRWAESRVPPARFLNVVRQDEFTFDVIVQVDVATYVVFDTT
ncbi:MAG: hypothetical protein AB7I30_04260 [Isosphaeraceae bacterium]